VAARRGGGGQVGEGGCALLGSEAQPPGEGRRDLLRVGGGQVGEGGCALLGVRRDRRAKGGLFFSSPEDCSLVTICRPPPKPAAITA